MQLDENVFCRRQGEIMLLSDGVSILRLTADGIHELDLILHASIEEIDKNSSAWNLASELINVGFIKSQTLPSSSIRKLGFRSQ